MIYFLNIYSSAQVRELRGQVFEHIHYLDDPNDKWNLDISTKLVIVGNMETFPLDIWGTEGPHGCLHVQPILFTNGWCAPT